MNSILTSFSLSRLSKICLPFLLLSLAGIATFSCSDDESKDGTDLEDDTAGDTAEHNDSDTEDGVSTDSDCPSPPAEETGFLWFSGYEQNPWEDQWGLLWSSFENYHNESDVWTVA